MSAEFACSQPVKDRLFCVCGHLVDLKFQMQIGNKATKYYQLIISDCQLERHCCSAMFLASAVRGRRRATTEPLLARLTVYGAEGDKVTRMRKWFQLPARYALGGASTFTGVSPLLPGAGGPPPPAPRLTRVRAPPLGRSACRRLAALPARPARRHRPASASATCQSAPMAPSRAPPLVTPAEHGRHLSVLSQRGARTELAWAAPAEAAVDCLVVHGSRALIMGRALDCLLAARWRTII